METAKMIKFTRKRGGIATLVSYPDKELTKLAGRELTEDELDSLLIDLGEDPKEEGCHGFKMFALLEHSKKEIKASLKRVLK